MKKKLIAIVTSLAMVATMVPSIAFAGTAGTKAAEPEVSIPSASYVAANLEAGGNVYAQYKEKAGESMNSGLGASNSGDKMTITGTLRYVEGLTEFSSIEGQQKGHYLCVKITPDFTGDNATATHWTFTNPSINEPGNITWQAPMAKSHTSEDMVVWLEGYNGVGGQISLADLNIKVYYLTGGDVVNSVQTVMTKDDLNTAIEAAGESIVGTSENLPTIDMSGTTQETKEDADKRAEESAANAAVKNFLDAVEKITVPISTYSKSVDDLVVAACDEYVILENSEVATVKKDYRDAYDKFEKAVEQQWNVRLDALDDAVLDVTPVEADNLKAVDTLATYCTEIATPGSMNTVLTKGIVPENGSLRKAIDDTTAAARTARDEAQKAKPIVEAIAKLPIISDSTYQEADKVISQIHTQYDGETNAVWARVGNEDEFVAKDKAVQGYKAEVKKAMDLIDEIPDITTLTDKNIKAYTEAYDAAYAAYSKLGRNQKAAVTNRGVLNTAAEYIANYGIGLDKEVAVKNAIDSLPAGTNAADTLAIAKAYAGLNGLSASPAGTLTQLYKGFQANVNQVLKDKLTKARAAILATLTENGRDTADEAAVATAVEPVKALIAALPATVTLADEGAVEEALEAYDAITSLADQSNTIEIAINTAIKKALQSDAKVLKAAETQLININRINKQAIQRFVDAVKVIGDGNLDAITDEDEVNATYRNNTVAARAAYEKLTDEQKAIVQRNGLVANAKKAYNALLQAEKNVAAAITVDQVAALIKAVPDAATLKTDDAEAVAKVKAAQTAYEALTAGLQAQLLRDKFITQAELDNYKAAVKKVADAEGKTAVTAAINAIKALTTLPTKFSNQAEINAAYTVLNDAEAAYNALTKEQKAAVTNAAVLEKYRTDFDRLMKNYADALYAKVKDLDADKLTAENIADIAELKAYIDGEYIDIADIAGFNQSVYDKLIAGLDTNAALENATVAPIDAVIYDGTAKEPAVTVTDKAGRTVPADAYVLSYNNNQNAGDAYVTVAAKTGSGYTGAITAKFAISPASLKDAAVSGLVNKTYTGKAVGQSLTVKAGDNNLARNKDYTQTYKNNKNVGEASVILTGTGNYTGSITKTFIVTPKKGAIKSLKAGKKQVTVKVTAQAGAKYRIVYQTVNKANNGKAKAVNTASTSKTIKSLKAGKTYKVKVRGYKVVDGKTYYGAYSAWKKAKVK